MEIETNIAKFKNRIPKYNLYLSLLKSNILQKDFFVLYNMFVICQLYTMQENTTFTINK